MSEEFKNITAYVAANMNNIEHLREGIHLFPKNHFANICSGMLLNVLLLDEHDKYANTINVLGEIYIEYMESLGHIFDYIKEGQSLSEYWDEEHLGHLYFNLRDSASSYGLYIEQYNTYCDMCKSNVLLDNSLGIHEFTYKYRHSNLLDPKHDTIFVAIVEPGSEKPYTKIKFEKKNLLHELDESQVDELYNSIQFHEFIIYLYRRQMFDTLKDFFVKVPLEENFLRSEFKFMFDLVKSIEANVDVVDIYCMVKNLNIDENTKAIISSLEPDFNTIALMLESGKKCSELEVLLPYI